MKTLQRNYTTPEQSKRLLELGLPADSADCAYRGQYMPITILSPNELYSTHEKEVHDLETKRDRREGCFQTCEPCWSVGRLIEIWLHCNKFSVNSTSEPITIGLIDFSNNFIDDFIHLIKKAVSSKHIDFSKLEE